MGIGDVTEWIRTQRTSPGMPGTAATIAEL